MASIAARDLPLFCRWHLCGNGMAGKPIRKAAGETDATWAWNWMASGFLVVDDERDSLEWVRRLLRECKAEVVVASSANDGLRLVAAEPPDVIVSDIGMPDKDGLEMIRELRARSRCRENPGDCFDRFRPVRGSDPRHACRVSGTPGQAGRTQELIAAVANPAGRTGISAS